MKGLKKFLAIFLIAALGIPATIVLPKTAKEVQASTNGHSQAEAVSWINGKIGTAIDADGAYGVQCVDLIKLYYQYLGQSLGSIGIAANMATVALPSGWTRDKSPRLGDIAVFPATTNGTGHVALVTEIQGGQFKAVDYNGTGNHDAGTTRTFYTSNASAFIHPDFSSTVNDGKAPEIKNAHITNATTTSYEVRFNAYDNSSISAQVGCWSDKWDIKNAKWYTVPFSGNYGAITIPISDMGGYKNCWYYCNIYVWDAFGNKSEATTVKVFIETKAPEIKNAHITNATTTSYEVRFNAYDDSSITGAQVGCWSDKWDIKNAKWYTVPFSGNYGAVTIPISDMGGYKNCWYYCNIYVWDAFGNKSEATTVKVFIDGKAPEIKNAYITNVSTTSYEVRFNAYDDSSISRAQVGCWSDKWGINDAKWYTVPFSGDKGAITIPISDMGGYKNCWYYCNIYVWDAFGNRSEATTVKVFNTEAVQELEKKANPLKIKVSSKVYKKSKLKKAKSFTIGTTQAQGKVTYALDKKAKKAKIKVSAKGKVTIPKKCKKGTYKIKVKAAGNKNYKSGSKTVTIKVK